MPSLRLTLLLYIYMYLHVTCTYCAVVFLKLYLRLALLLYIYVYRHVTCTYCSVVFLKLYLRLALLPHVNIERCFFFWICRKGSEKMHTEIQDFLFSHPTVMHNDIAAGAGKQQTFVPVI